MVSGLQIKVVSDLHLEAPAAYDIFTLKHDSPHLALLGDIGYVKDAGFFEFLKTQLLAFRLVFFLLGNHEPYHGSWESARKKLEDFRAQTSQARQDGEKYGEFVVLDQTRYDFSSDITILGCTLHSEVQPAQKDHVSFGLNDFYYIQDWTVEAHNEAHSSDLAWLNNQVQSISESEPHRRVVILTHHCPSIDERTSNAKFKDSKISSGFSTDLSKEPCWTSPNVKLWMFGHTHFNCDFVDETTGKRVLTNQRGYYFQQSAGFSVEGCIEL